MTFVHMTIISKNINDAEIFLRQLCNKMQVFPVCFVHSYGGTFLWARESVVTSARTVRYFWEVVIFFNCSENIN